MEKEDQLKVCVTGGSGYIAASLIKKLLLQGYTVHATLRNLKDECKVGFLRRLPHAEARLVLFEVDIFKPQAFEAAIHGCHFVFHVAHPILHHHQPSQYRSLTETAVEATKEIARYCVKETTVRRLIYAASVLSASPLADDDATSFKDFIDESCWTPLHHLPNFPYINCLHQNSEREILSYNKRKKGWGLEVVSLACELVGGDTVLMSSMPLSVEVLISQLKDSEMAFQSMRFMEEFLGKIQIVHIQNVCDAHIFCIQKPHLTGRFLVASSSVSSSDIANYYRYSYPEFHVKHKYLEGPNREIKWDSTKLKDEGFAYKWDMKATLDDCVRCARMFGGL